MRRKTVGNKVVSVLLAGALAASLAACGGNTANTGADAGNNAADAGTKEDTKSAETETAADTEESSDAAVADSGYEAKDLGGRTIKIGLWWDEYWDRNSSVWQKRIICMLYWMVYSIMYRMILFILTVTMSIWKMEPIRSELILTGHMYTMP